MRTPVEGGARAGTGSTRAPILKRLLLGRPLAHEEAGHQLLPKILALPVFASDALSSNAYATEEILHVLILAGPAVLGTSIPIALAVSTLMTIVVVSYRQTVRAYPGGGGAYIVSRENLGELPGLIAAASLLIDYVLTVSVSIAAGAFAVASLVPGLLDNRVGLSLAFVAVITLANLRGARESGLLFAIPTYVFIVSTLVMVAAGLWRCTVGDCPNAEVPLGGEEHVAGAAFGVWLVLRAFASGSTALTGVEAIANGVPAFRGKRPSEQARNAATTLGMLGVVSITMFMGITFLAHRMDARPSGAKSVVAQIADATFGGGFGFAAVQIATALILILAANTAYQDFPRLSSILARDRFMPRQFVNRGDRLVFSNGIVVLALIASALIVLYDAEVTRLIQLYVVGVFTSFTLSQTGMVRRWRRLRGPGWRHRAILNGIGAVATGIVLVVVASTKFTRGAWIVIVAVPLIVTGFKAIHRHYASVAVQLRRPEDRPREIRGTRAVVLVARVDEATMRALGYARALRPLEVRAMHVGRGEEATLVRATWTERRLNVALDVVEGDPNDITDAVRSYVRALSAAPDEYVTVVLPELFGRKGWRQFLSRRKTLLLKAALLFERRVVLTDVPTIAGGAGALPRPLAPTPTTADGDSFTHTTGGDGSLTRAITPTRTVAVVLVSAVHNATLRALEYAKSLSPTDLRALTFNIDPDETARVLADWTEAVADVPLEAVDSPYREMTTALVRYVRRLRSETPDAVVSVIVPEFVVRRWWHQFLHNQTALAIKAGLLFEPGVVLTSVPFHLT